ncbi:extracellular solute-binding protein [Pararhizobium haloflavum]|uniref:extracellular solute-binding protein n=1 Tax=Pararhizobium haloflavum TaxID=2037914 RepID=UPI000C183BBD|nr:extracellular solute-binding protein [Pararhizobium haloflavum]
MSTILGTRIAQVASLLAITALCGVHALPADAQDAPDRQWRHGVALIGQPEYQEGFDHFDYVNPDAPKGGTLRLSATGSFDTFNPLLSRGELASGLTLVYETLMEPSMDEVSAEYGLLAEALSYPDDYSSVTFRLREGAQWHDGKPVTPEDVVWSFEKAIELDPQRQFYYQHVTGAEVTGEREVTFTFDQTDNRELPQIVGQLLILPKHWWEGEGPNGQPRDIGATTLEPPLGSGPYKLSSFQPGSDVSYERVEDYWGADLPVRIGTNNFDRIDYTYFADRSVEFEAFKAGNFDYWFENAALRWETGYEFPAAQDGRVVREELENPYRSSGSLVGFIPNLRQEKFQDPRVRQALNYAFDFEELNRTIFYGAYERIDSYFYGTELASDGLPQGEELEILESVGDKLPETVFTTEYKNPVGGGPQAMRDNLREAVRLFGEAGYEIRNNRMVNAQTGEPFEFEIILNGPTIERVALPFVENLRRIGVSARVRTIEPSQYINRIRSRDFDVIYAGWGQSLSPGNEQWEYWGSRSADREGSQNFAGIADEGIDALIQKVVFADDRDTLVAATRALDRALLAHHYVVPSYTSRTARIAYWDKFGRPDELPEYSIGFPDIWWSKAAAEAPQPGEEG